MLAHPAVDAIMAADTSISRHEQSRFVLLMSFILPLFEIFQTPIDATTAPTRTVAPRQFA